MWWYVGFPLAVGAAVLGRFLRHRNQRAHWAEGVADLVRQAQAGSPISRSLAAGVLAPPMSTKAEARFLEGCLLLRAGEPARAVTSFQRAYHGCPDYELAAIFVFTCMRMSRADMPQLLRIFLETWKTMRRRDVPSTSRESLFLSLLKAQNPEPPPEDMSPLGELLWTQPIPTLRVQLSNVAKDKPAWANPLLRAGPPGSSPAETSAQTQGVAS